MATMDPEFGHQIAAVLEANGVKVLTSVKVESVADRTVVLGDGRRLPADLVLFSVGVRPELTLARKAGLEIGADRRRCWSTITCARPIRISTRRAT